MVTRYKTILCIFLFIFITILNGCTNSEVYPEDEILNYMLPADPLTLDPQIAEDLSGTVLTTNLFEGLVRTDNTGNIIPGMAESWDISSDGLTYTFHLIKGSCWSNGTEVTAKDFAFGIERAVSPDTMSPNASVLYSIKNASAIHGKNADISTLGVTALDDYTLEIRLEYETNALLLALTEPVAMPCNKEFFSSTKGKYGKDYDLIITNGAFEIRENYGWDHEKYIYLRRSSDYKGLNKAIPAGINFTYGDMPENLISAVTSQEIDLCEIYGTQLEEAKENNLNITTSTNTLWGICYNTDVKAFKNAKLRVSLFGSLNRNNLLKHAPNSYVPTNNLIGNDILYAGKNYRDEVGNIVLMPADNAKEMYTKAKEELAENEIELKNSYTIICLNDSASSELVTGIIEEWNSLTGCYFNKEPLPRGELESRMESGDYEIAIAPLNTSMDSPMELLSKFVSDSSENYINLNYPAYDKFIDTALSENGDSAIEALSEAESYLVDYAYLYPLYYESRYFATASNVSGVIFSTTGEGIDFTQVTKIPEE